uniref:Uncharacterized protein n=1 Tax=Arundo donax TaxID=35708 RepID=A0A0A9DFD7_ARUDO
MLLQIAALPLASCHNALAALAFMYAFVSGSSNSLPLVLVPDNDALCCFVATTPPLPAMWLALPPLDLAAMVDCTKLCISLLLWETFPFGYLMTVCSPASSKSGWAAAPVLFFLSITTACMDILDVTAYLECSCTVSKARCPTRSRITLCCAKASWHFGWLAASSETAQATMACTFMGPSLSTLAKAKHAPACTICSTHSGSRPRRPMASVAFSWPSRRPSLTSLSSGGTPSSSMMSLEYLSLSRARETRLAAASARASRLPV